MESTVDTLLREVAALRARVEELEASASPPAPPGGRSRSRRQMLKLAGATLAGAAAGAAGIAGSAVPAFADTGNNMILGHSGTTMDVNTADRATQLDYTGNTNVGAALLVTANGFGGPYRPSMSDAAALVGFAFGDQDFAVPMPNAIVGATDAAGGIGVVAINSHDYPGAANAGLHAESVRGYAGEFWIRANGKAQVFLKPSGSAGAPAAAGHQNGELYVDSNGVLYYFVDGAFKRVALGQTSLVTMLTAPIRLLESRPAFEDPSPGQTKPHRPIGSGEKWEVPITGQVMAGVQVPSGAKAVIGNLTVTNPIGAGYLTLFPHGAPQPGTSSINYGPGATVANGVIVGLSSGGLVDFYASAQTDVIFDAAGYIV